MSSDICNAFRTNFTYGKDKYDTILKDQWTECCSSQLAKNPHVDSIDSMFDDTNLTRVAMPIMKCQIDKVNARKNRETQIDSMCQTDETWEDMAKDPTLPQFVKKSKEGKADFIGSCMVVMRAKDAAKGTTGRQLEVALEDAKADILARMGENGVGGDGKGSLWKKNVDNIKVFCHDAGYGNWTGSEGACCVSWVKQNMRITDVPPNPNGDINNSFSQHLIGLNDAATLSLDSQLHSDNSSLHHQCGMHGWL